MPVNYSQKRLLSAALHTKGNSKHARRMRLYAFLMGIMSLLISLVTLYLYFIKAV